jgi:hypothetical protein
LRKNLSRVPATSFFYVGAGYDFCTHAAFYCERAAFSGKMELFAALMHENIALAQWFS